MAQAALAVQQDLDALAQTIRSADQGVAHAVNNMVTAALTAGDALIQAKAQVEHGGWRRYLKDSCDLSEDRAERYMRLARGRDVIEANSARVRNLSLTQALKLVDEHERKFQPRVSDSPKAPKAAKAVERLNSLAWSNASPAERTQFVEAVGLDALLAAAPSSWDLQELLLCDISTAALLAEVARRKPARAQNTQKSEVTALGRGHRHAGVTLEHEPTATAVSITTQVETKH